VDFCGGFAASAPYPMAKARGLRGTYLVIACGDCAINGGIFRDAYGVVGPVQNVVPVDLEIPGCPPHPTVITEVLRALTGR
jgi:Ni,Fe-hydrogenase III small subunit